jgi:hypothetical protein
MSEYPMNNWWEVGTAVNLTWTAAGSAREAISEARRIRRMHKQMPIAFPLPITVWAVRTIPHGTKRKRIIGNWERGCRCCTR